MHNIRQGYQRWIRKYLCMIFEWLNWFRHYVLKSREQGAECNEVLSCSKETKITKIIKIVGENMLRNCCSCKVIANDILMVKVN